MEQQIVHLKLINGEQLVGQLKKQTKKNTTINTPLAIRVMIDPSNESQSIGLFQYSELADLELTIKFSNDHIIAIIPTSADISKVYSATINKLSTVKTKAKSSTALENTPEEQLEQLADYLNTKPISSFPPFTKKVH